MIVETQQLGTITLGTHFFKVKYHSMGLAGHLLRFMLKYVTYKIQSDEINDVFGTRNAGLAEYRFHICQYVDFLEYLKRLNINIKLFDIVEKPLYEPARINVEPQDGFEDRDYQIAADAFIQLDEPGDFHSRFLSMPTGTGKTFVSLKSAAKRGQRIAVIVLPTYQEKWAADAVKYLKVDPKRVLIVSESKPTRNMINTALADELDVDIIILSLTTQKVFNGKFEKGEDEHLYEIHPEDLFETLGVGTVIIDEAHQHLFGVFGMMLYMHVPKLIALSATFMDDDKTIAMMQRKMFPREIRFDDIKPEKYTKVTAVSYNISRNHKNQIRTTERGSNMYSHGAFEKSIMKNPVMRDRYFAIVKEMFDEGYIKNKMPGDKVAIFVQSIKMATMLVEFLRKCYPELTIERYVEDDPYENIIEPDARVTTIGSGGTAIDVPMLRISIMTTSINASKSNIQVLGRTRKMNDRDTKFWYLYSPDIPKQRDYHEKKKILFADRVASHREVRSDILL